MARRVRDGADGDRKRNSRADRRRQDPNFAPGALLVRHWRIFYFRCGRCNP
jgi:hypothetical protein